MIGFKGIYRFFEVTGRVFGRVGAKSIAASVIFAGCVSTANAWAEQLSLTAQNTSCLNPIILQHSLKGENKDTLSSTLISATDRLTSIIGMGYDIIPINEALNVPAGHVVTSKQNCGQADVYSYRVRPQIQQQSELTYDTLYVRHMTRAAVKADPTVTCQPSYTQIYQPPLKLGGSVGVS